MKKLISALLLAALLSGCAASVPAETPAPTPSPTPVPTAAPTPTPMPTPEPLIIGGQSFDISSGSVDLRGISLTNEEKLALRETHPDLAFGWVVDVLGVEADSSDTYICLDNIPMEDTTALETLLPLLPNVTKIDMCGCGLDNETMYELNQRHEGIRFIWVAPIASALLRTDATYFNHNDIGMISNVTDEKLDRDLRYFPDLVALDLGHSTFALKRCDWLQHTPKLQYLILADCTLQDITPIGELSELKYLEIFTNPHITDISALGKLSKLETLNISVTAVEDVTPLQNCGALRYCWLNYCWALPEESVNALAAALPDCLINHTPYGPTSGGWRDLDVYFEMRDAFHSDYMRGDWGQGNFVE